MPDPRTHSLLFLTLLASGACSPMADHESRSGSAVQAGPAARPAASVAPAVEAGSAHAIAAADTAADKAADVQALALPGGSGGIGFDDLRFSRRLGRVLVPGGRTGKLYLVDPANDAVQAIAGFSAKAGFSGGHGDGTTSVDEGDGLLYAIDRTSRALLVLDAEHRVTAQVALGGGPDYVRFVAPTRELWVTEPDAEAIEVFRLGADTKAAPQHIASIAVPGGPESLVVDATRGRAWTHTWTGGTVGIDLATRAIVAQFPNGCSASRGIALDEARGLLFAGCAEGRATVLDLAHDGRVLSSAETGAGVDIIDYDPRLGHLYVPGGKSGTLTVLGVGEAGALQFLGTIPMSAGCHSVVTDGEGHVFVGDPDTGSLLVFRDSFPASVPAPR